MTATKKTSPNDFAADLRELADLIENDPRAAHIETAREAVRVVARDVIHDAEMLCMLIRVDHELRSLHAPEVRKLMEAANLVLDTVISVEVDSNDG